MKRAMMMRSQCHEPLTSNCTDNNACCINAIDYYKNFFKGILVKQGVSESIIHPNITEGLFQSLLNFTQNKTDDLFEQEDQDQLSKSCLHRAYLPWYSSGSAGCLPIISSKPVRHAVRAFSSQYSILIENRSKSNVKTFYQYRYADYGNTRLWSFQGTR